MKKVKNVTPKAVQPSKPVTNEMRLGIVMDAMSDMAVRQLDAQEQEKILTVGVQNLYANAKATQEEMNLLRQDLAFTNNSLRVVEKKAHDVLLEHAKTDSRLRKAVKDQLMIGTAISGLIFSTGLIVSALVNTGVPSVIGFLLACLFFEGTARYS